MILIRLSFFVMVSLLCVACALSSSQTPALQPCTYPWFERVEEQFPTGDGRGHGPDLGSAEWMSVVEFKLGIRGDAGIPARGSEQWCKFINQRYIKNTQL